MHIQRIKPAHRRKVFLRESYRRNGKVMKRTLADLSRWSEQGVTDLSNFLIMLRKCKRQGIQVSAIRLTLHMYCRFGGESCVMEFINPFRESLTTTSDAPGLTTT